MNPNFRNPFLITLLKELIKSEAGIVFRTRAYEKYMSLPRPFKTRNLDKIRELKPTHSARSLRNNFIENPGFRYTNEMLDRAVKCLAFYCKYNSWAEFVQYYGKFEAAQRVEHLRGLSIGEIDESDLYFIDREVERYVRTEDTYFQLTRELTDNPYLNTIRVPDKHLIRSADNEDLEGIHKQMIKTNYRITIRRTSSHYWEKNVSRLCFVLVNAGNKVVGLVGFRDRLTSGYECEIYVLGAREAEQLGYVLDNLTAIINNFLDTIPFDGTIVMYCHFKWERMLEKLGFRSTKSEKSILAWERKVAMLWKNI